MRGEDEDGRMETDLGVGYRDLARRREGEGVKRKRIEGGRGRGEDGDLGEWGEKKARGLRGDGQRGRRWEQNRDNQVVEDVLGGAGGIG